MSGIRDLFIIQLCKRLGNSLGRYFLNLSSNCMCGCGRGDLLFSSLQGKVVWFVFSSKSRILCFCINAQVAGPSFEYFKFVAYFLISKSLCLLICMVSMSGISYIKHESKHSRRYWFKGYYTEFETMKLHN